MLPAEEEGVLSGARQAAPTPSAEAAPVPITLSVHSLDGPSIKVTGLLTDKIQHFVEQVIKAKEYGDRKRVRLIFQGRLLDNNATAEASRLRDQCSVHCAVSEQQSQRNREVRINVRPAAGAQIPPSSGARRGFDRLLEMGFSAEDVAQFREVFRQSRPSGDLTGEERIDYDAEDEWIANSAHAIEEMREERRTSAGTTAELVFGLALGSLLGVVMLIWLGDSSLSVRARIGIVLGVAINLFFSMSRTTSSRNKTVSNP